MRYERPALLLAVFLAVVLVWRALAILFAPVAGARFDQLEPVECWFTIPKDRVAHCGYLTVPDHRGRAVTTYSRLAVAVFSPANGPTKRDPVLFLSGGPGGAFGFNAGKGWWWNWIDTVTLSHGREFVAMDQRGVGRSLPRVDCPGLRVLEARLMRRDVTPEDEDEAWLDAVESCHQRLLGREVDFSTFGSSESAADIEDLRNALGYRLWNLYGISYGTRLALTVAHQYPEGVRALVLDSVYPDEAQSLVEGPEGLDRALRRVWESCEGCEGTGDALARVVERLNQKPIRVRFVHPVTLEKVEVVVDGDRLIDAMVVGLSGHVDVRRLAEAVAGVDRGDVHAATELMRDSWLASQDQDFSYPVNYAVECREEIPFNDADDALRRANQLPMVSRHERRDTEVLRRICAQWGLQPDPRHNEPVRTSIPALILSGIFDPVTPSAWAQRTLQYLPNAHLLLFNAGHSVTDADSCALELIASFLDAPDRQPTADCYPRAGAQPFVRP